MNEFLVNNCETVASFIIDVLGLDCEITYIDDDDETSSSGSVVVFDAIHEEHELIREFITDSGYWSE